MTAASPSAFDAAAVPRLTMDQAARWSRFVRRLRVGLPSMVIIIAVVFAGFIIKSAIENGLNGQRNLTGGEVVTMVQPRFSGRDKSGERYVIVAESAQRRFDGTARIDLVKPVFTDAFGSIVQAPIGVFDRNLGTLDLSERVSMRDAEGYDFLSDSAVFYVGDRKFVGNTPLKGSGPLGTVRSDSYEVLGEGDHIMLRGKVEMVLYNGTDPDEAEAIAPKFEDFEPIDVSFGLIE